MKDIDHMHDKVFVTMNLCSEDKYMKVNEVFEPFDKTYEVCQRYYSQECINQIHEALRVAMGLCDIIPTRLQEHKDKQVADIGDFVNTQGAYHIILDALEKIKHLENKQ